MPNSKNAERDQNSPWWSSAIVLYVGVAMMIIGALLMFYLEGTFRFFLGGALIILGALSPIFTFFIFGKKS